MTELMTRFNSVIPGRCNLRRPEPWYWEKRRGWYIQINKKQERLGPDPDPRRAKDGSPIAPPEVMREYHRLMATNNLTREVDRARATVPEVCEAFLATKSKLAPNTFRCYQFFMKKLCEKNMRRRFSALRPADVEQIADAVGTWGDATKHDFVSHVACLFGWAKDSGFADFNALAGYDNPYESGKRERALTDAEFRLLMDQATDLQFKQIMMFMRGTGCRPGEARKLTAEHVHPTQPFIVLGKKEHKTGWKTKKKRAIPMPEDVETMVRALAKRYPTGPLFRNSRNGGGWCKDAIPKRFRDYRRKLGLPEDTVPYLIRHASVTRMLDRGHDSHLVAAIHGHQGDQTTLGVYYHAGKGRVIEAINDTFKLDPSPEPEAPGA